MIEGTNTDSGITYNPEKYRRRVPKYKVIGEEKPYFLVEISYDIYIAHALILEKDLEKRCPGWTSRHANILEESRGLKRRGDHGQTPVRVVTVAADSSFGVCGSPPQWDSLSQDVDMGWDFVASILFHAWMLIEWSDTVRTWEKLEDIHYSQGFSRYEIYQQLAEAGKGNEERFRTLSRVQHYDRHGYSGREKVLGRN
jgi:hypothetical protein